jgi:tRNA A-37 threonylcarbamoyl transferase component Bud32
MVNEETLKGGRSTSEVIRIDNTVHRTCGLNSEFTHKLLILLEEKKFAYAPKYLGIDEKGREILTFIDGEVPKDKQWTMEQMVKIVKMMKSFHDKTVGSQLAGNNETVCHHDIAPWNIVLKEGKPIAFIDFDEAEPGERVDDLSYFLWTFLDLGSNVSIETQSSKMKTLCQAYGYHDGKKLVEAILEQQNLILGKRLRLAKTEIKKEDREFSADAAERIKKEIVWVKENREKIELAI